MREFGVLDPELPVQTWTSGLREKGEIPFSSDQNAPALSCMLVNGDDQQSGMGVVYAATEDQTRLSGCYIPTDKDGKVNFNGDPLMRRSRLYELRQETILFSNLSSINYHKASQQVLLTSTTAQAHEQSASRRAQVVIFSPLSTSHSDVITTNHAYAHEQGPRPSWLLGESESQLRLILPRPWLTIHTARLAPASHGSSALTALLATNDGLMRVTDSENPVQWVTPPPPSQQPTPRYNSEKPPWPRDSLAVDWHPTNPAIIFPGTRDGRFFRIDTRVNHWGQGQGQARGGDGGGGGGGGCEWFRHRSSVAHLRVVDDGGNQLLAAGPRGAMAIYDLRWMQGIKKRAKEVRPVVRMHSYKNAAHVHIGLDVATIGGGMGKVVAAGMDDGTVGVFSLRTGRKLRAGGLDDPGKMKLGDDAVVKCLQWEKMPWENDPSLWVGAGPVVKKFSFGLDEDEDGDC